MRTILALTVLASAAYPAATAADLQSGLEVGECAGAYYVADVTGPSAGEKLCYRCRYGNRPVVNIFARTMDENVTKLVKQIDDVVAKNRDNGMAAFVVMLSDDPDAQEASLKKVAASQKLQHTPLTVFDNSVGPGKYKIAKDADITVMMWVESDVKVNHAYKAGELTGDAIAQIVGDTQKILK